MKRRLAAHGRRVGIGSVLQQEDDDVHAAHEAGDVQRRQSRLPIRPQMEKQEIGLLSVAAWRSSIRPYLGGGFDGGAVLEQQLDHFDAVLLAGDVQGRETVEGPRVGIGLAVQQQLGHADVTAVGSYVQGRQIVDRHLIDGRLVVQQDPSGVHVIALRRHVQRRQTILSTIKELRQSVSVIQGTRWQHLGLGRNGGSSFQQQIDHVLVSGAGGAVQWRQSVARLGLEIGVLVQEDRDHVGFAPFGRHMQRSDVMLNQKKIGQLRPQKNPRQGTHFGQEVDVGSFLNQKAGDVLVAVMSGDVQRSEAAFGCDVRIVIALSNNKRSISTACSSAGG